jgi:hypothetical protein
MSTGPGDYPQAGGADNPGGAGGPPGSRLSEPARVEAFSDGVLAIVITLLVLDLRAGPFPRGAMLHHLLQQWPTYLAYFVKEKRNGRGRHGLSRTGLVG